MAAHVLVVEDDPTFSLMLQLYLAKEGYRVSVAADGIAGVKTALTGKIDLLLLDLMLPQIDGWEVCRRVRLHDPQLPILLVTAVDQEGAKVQGLDLGADDYVTKPVAISELLARVRALLRRSRRTPPPPVAESLSFEGLLIDPASRRVLLEGQRLELPPKEFDLLHTLAREPGRVFTHDELLWLIWRYPAGTDPRTLHTHVMRLRRKLESGSRSYLQTSWGVGFKFEVSSR